MLYCHSFLRKQSLAFCYCSILNTLDMTEILTPPSVAVLLAHWPAYKATQALLITKHSTFPRHSYFPYEYKVMFYFSD